VEEAEGLVAGVLLLSVKPVPGELRQRPCHIPSRRSGACLDRSGRRQNRRRSQRFCQSSPASRPHSWSSRAADMPIGNRINEWLDRSQLKSSLSRSRMPERPAASSRFAPPHRLGNSDGRKRRDSESIRILRRHLWRQ
jgi:hypothetical protein